MLILLKRNINFILISFIILIAALLRLIKPFDIPFTPDELSTLFRLEFSNFSELIQKAVKVDAHPAGVQVFLYYWTGFFGKSEFIVKLPFMLSGIASVYLIYVIGKSWFNPMAGLVSASFAATIQYTVMYSQIARPYGSGIFLSLLMVYFWDKVIFHNDRHFNRNLTFFILSAAACAYNHHFSLLFAFITGITGVFLVNKKFLIKYLLSGFAIFLLYLPHLEIFFYQLNIGGVELWLGKPAPGFILKYLQFIFHFSPALLFLASLLLITGIFYSRFKLVKPIYYWISIAWFTVPFLTGYFYSVYFSAVLQFSVLIFSFPFLLFLLFGQLPDFNPYTKTIIVITVCSASIFTLVFERNYYDIGYRSNYKQNVEYSKESKRKFGNDVVIILDGYRDMNEHFINDDTFQFRQIEDFESKNHFISFLNNRPEAFLSLGSVSGTFPEIVPLILENYPFVAEKKDNPSGSYYLFSKKNKIRNIQKKISFNDFKNPVSGWTMGMKENYISDTSGIAGGFAFLMDATLEWSPTFTTALKDLDCSRNDFIDISATVNPLSEPAEILLVSVLESNGKTIEWRAADLKDYVTEKPKSIKIHHSVKLSDVPHLPVDTQLKIYIWNRGRSKFLIKNIEIKTREGNPLLYSIFNDFEI